MKWDSYSYLYSGPLYTLMLTVYSSSGASYVNAGWVLESEYRLKKYIYFFETISWTLIQLIWKIILLVIFYYFSYIFIAIGDKVLKPFNSQGIKLFMVLCVFPLTLNGIYYWKLDSLVKKRKEQYFVQVKCANEDKI